MRNSFNTAGFSEVVHEILAEPDEAWFRYFASATYKPHRGLTARLHPALLGTVKSARNFSISLHSDHGESGSSVASLVGEPTPLDLALTGIAACSLTTLIGGGTAQGVIFDGAMMLIAQDKPAFVEPDPMSAGKGPVPISCHFEVDAQIDEQQLAELVGKARDFSPNLQTLAQSVPIDVAVVAEGQTTSLQIPIHGQKGTEYPSRRRVQWISGPQFESMPVDADLGAVLRVDQPKQVTGVDWGPNPQEYLCMGIAADVVECLVEVGRRRLGRSLEWEVSAEAREDLRGFFQVTPDSVVHLQGVTCTIRVPAGIDSDSADDIIKAAVARSRVVNLVRQRHTVELLLTRPSWAQDEPPLLVQNRHLVRGKRGRAATP